MPDNTGAIPDGEYLVQCSKMGHLRNKNGDLVGNGKTLDFDFAVIGGPQAKRHIYTTVSIDQEWWAKYPASEVVLAKLVMAAGHNDSLDLECSERVWQTMFHSKVFKLKVSSKEDKNGFPRTHIQAVRTLTEEETGIKQALEFDVLAADTTRHEAVDGEDALPF